MIKHHTIEGLGVSGFVTWEGVVESRNDPLQIGRVQVRIIGFHTKNKDSTANKYDALTTNDLPWAMVLMPPTSSGMTGLGVSMHNLVEGSRVFGFFRDGNRGEQPVILGVYVGITESIESSDITTANYNTSGKTRLETEGFFDPRTSEELNSAPRPPQSIDDDSLKLTEASSASHYPQDKNATFQTRSGSMIGEPDTHKLTRGQWEGTCIDQRKSSRITQSSLPYHSTPNKGKLFDTMTIAEPEDFYNAKYPYNKVIETESGNVIELDDTPGAERIHVWHRSGAYYQMGPDGSISQRSTGKTFTYSKGNSEHLVAGDYKLNAKGNYRIYCKGATLNITDGVVTIVGKEIFATSSGDTTFEVGGKFSVKAMGGIDLSTPASLTVSSPTASITCSAYNLLPFQGMPPIISTTFMAPWSILSPLLLLATGGLSLSGMVTGSPLMVSGPSSTPLNMVFNTPVNNTFTQQVSENFTSKNITIAGTSTETVTGAVTQSYTGARIVTDVGLLQNSTGVFNMTGAMTLNGFNVAVIP